MYFLVEVRHLSGVVVLVPRVGVLVRVEVRMSMSLPHLILKKCLHTSSSAVFGLLEPLQVFCKLVYLGCVRLALEMPLPLCRRLLALQKGTFLSLVGVHLVKQVFSCAKALSPLVLGL